ncbi:MAG TPA: PQQ-binding-like beta-propeller repeat protein [Anaerolineae bacterium]|jgi:outer membrane protein assembly factor BamB|nr:PQQ-binding-like beta-propeller repeat protein [Anaerolineae bacterium]
MAFRKTFSLFMMIPLFVVACQNRPVPEDETVVEQLAVADGVVYIGSIDGLDYGLDVKDGRLLWSFDTGRPVFLSPAVANDRVFVGSDSGFVYALDGRQRSVVSGQLSDAGDRARGLF